MAAPKHFFATTGQCVTRDGKAHAICSVAVDREISELVDVPNFVVSTFPPLDIFVG